MRAANKEFSDVLVLFEGALGTNAMSLVEHGNISAKDRVERPIRSLNTEKCKKLGYPGRKKSLLLCLANRKVK